MARFDRLALLCVGVLSASMLSCHHSQEEPGTAKKPATETSAGDSSAPAATPNLPAAAMVGVNLVSVHDFAPSVFPDFLKQLHDAKVPSVLVWDNVVPPAKDPVPEFLTAANAQGIRVILAVPLMWVMTNVRPVPTLPSGQPDPKFNDAKGVSRLSDASPDEFRKYFQPLFEQVEARGIELAGIVVGNEHNWAISNGDFTLPGQGRALGRADLDTDPEGKAVARGLLQYLKVLAVAKEMRDHSRVNRRTPLITFGMFDPKPPHYPTAAMQLDAVTVPATLDFLREHGLDQLVDVYGIHTYPWPDWTAEETWDHLDHQTLVNCRAPGARDGKPCWLTEWGFQSTTPCPAGGAGPIEDAKRTALVTTVTKHLHEYVESRRLIGLDYYSWNSGPEVGSPPAPLSIFRCGELTESGRLAIQRP